MSPVFPGFPPRPVNVSREAALRYFRSGWAVQPKLDGERRLVVLLPGREWQVWTRTGRLTREEFPGDGVDIPVGTMLDCEMVSQLGWRNMRRVPTTIWHVHDIVIEADYDGASVRLATLGRLVGWDTADIAPVLPHYAKGIEPIDHMDWLEWLSVQPHSEGVVLKAPFSTYKWADGPDSENPMWVKWKP